MGVTLQQKQEIEQLKSVVTLLESRVAALEKQT
jgi:polyhydroxyalkanoate synthesis regulator phasin